MGGKLGGGGGVHGAAGSGAKVCRGEGAEERPLTGSARLLGDGQGDLREGEDVDLGPVLGGRGGQDGQVCLVLFSLGVVELLPQRRTPGLVSGQRHPSPPGGGHPRIHGLSGSHTLFESVM